MCLKTGVLFAAIAASISTAAQAAIIVDYNLTGLTTTAPASTPATNVGTGIVADTLTRGPGIIAAGLTNGFSSNDWTLNSSAALAQTNGDYYQWGFDVDATHTVSVASFDANMRRSAISAPSNFLLYASLDDFATAGTLVDTFTYLGRSSGTAGSPTPFQWMTTDTPGQDGNPLSQQDLSGASILQNIAPGSSVTFRLYGWSNAAGAAASNTVAFGRTQGPLIQGTITEVQVPEPASLVLCFGFVVAGVLIRRR